MTKFEQLIEIGARALHAVDPHSYGENFENCRAKEWETRDARAVITAALPLIREMITDEYLGVLPKSVGVDPDWKQKIELAKQARERPPAPPSPKPLAIKEGGKRRP